MQCNVTQTITYSTNFEYNYNDHLSKRCFSLNCFFHKLQKARRFAEEIHVLSFQNKGKWSDSIDGTQCHFNPA
jgi:hypothetical protein